MKNLTDKNEIKKLSTERAAIERASLTPDVPDKDVEDDQGKYFLENGFWCRTKSTKDGKITIPLANFTAKISAENIIDDGRDTQHLFTIDGALKGEQALPPLEVEAKNFTGMGWISKWGAKPCLEPGQTVKDFVRHAIQKNSNGVRVTTHFAHTGWRNIGDQKVYLHAGGAIGNSNGDVNVKLPRELQKYFFSSLPPFTPNQNYDDTKMTDAKIDALKTSLAFLDIGNRAVTLPLFCLAYLAPLTTLLNPMPNFSLYLFGMSGVFKTTLAILTLSHFGNFSDVENLSNFDDTIGILEKRSFILKDTVLCCDDYHPSSSKHNAQNRENTVQRLIRNYSNRTARGRLNADMSERGRYEPRGMLLMTAEELPTLESTLARVSIVEVAENSIDKQKLSAFQKTSALLPEAMADYITWIRENMPAIVESFPARFIELRQNAMAEGFHRKLPEQAAFLGFALETAMSFSHDRGILSDAQCKELVDEGWYIFKLLAEKQQRRIADDDPIKLFGDILATLVHQHGARLDPTGDEGEPLGAADRIGFYDASYLYLLPTAAWHAIQRFCILEGTHFPFQRNTFYQMLRNRKVIQPGPEENTIFVKIKGKSYRVLKVIDGGLYQKTVTTVTG